MQSLSALVHSHWNAPIIAVNLVIFANILGAMLLGMVVGYERTYHGRAAGMRTYAIVCMAACALTVFSAYPQFWYGGETGLAASAMDPTKIMQGIVTGVGFLGAGVIMKEGMNIVGLTSAASIWLSAAIGILVGVGFYPTAILLTLLSVFLLVGVARLETYLPSRPTVAVTLRFRAGHQPDQASLISRAQALGLMVALDSLSVGVVAQRQQWTFIASYVSRGPGSSLANLANHFASLEGVEEFQLTHTRD